MPMYTMSRVCVSYVHYVPCVCFLCIHYVFCVHYTVLFQFIMYYKGIYTLSHPLPFMDDVIVYNALIILVG